MPQFKPLTQFLVNFFVVLWIMSIPFKNAFYQGSVFFIILSFLLLLFYKDVRTYWRIFIQHYYDLLFYTLFIMLSIIVANILSDLNELQPWHPTIMYFFRYFLLFYILLFFYFLHLFTKQLLLTAIFSSLLIQALDGLYQYIYTYDFFFAYHVPQGVWLQGAVFSNNPFGMLMALGVVMSFLGINKIAKEKQSKLYFFIVIAIFYLFLFNALYSFSRASWIFLITFFTLFLINKQEKIDKIVYILLSATLLLAISALFFDDMLFHRFENLLEGDSSSRYAIWSDTLQHILKNPFFGYGFNSYALIRYQEFSSVHNSLLEILLYIGLLGFSIFTFLLYKIFQEIRNSKNGLFFSLFFSFLVISQFDHSVATSKIFLSVLTLFAFFIYAPRIESKSYSSLKDQRV